MARVAFMYNLPTPQAITSKCRKCSTLLYSTIVHVSYAEANCPIVRMASAQIGLWPLKVLFTANRPFARSSNEG